MMAMSKKYTVSNLRKPRNKGIVKNNMAKLYFIPKEEWTENKTKATKPKEKGFIEKASDFIGATPLAKGLGIGLARSTPEMKSLERRIKTNTASTDEIKLYADIMGEAPTSKQIVGSAVSTVANFIPGVGRGAKLATKVAAGAGTGYAMDVGRGLQTKETVKEALTPSYGTAVGAALPVVGAILGKATKGISARDIEQTSLRLTRTEADNLAKKGQDIAKYISDKKIIGTPEKRYEKISTLYDDMENKIQGTLKGSKIKLNKEDVLTQLKQVPEEFADDPAAYNEVSNKVTQVVDVIEKKQGEWIPAETLNTIKRNIFDRAYGKNNTDIINDSYKAMGDRLKSVLDDNIPGLSKLNKEYGILIASKRALFKAINREQTGMLEKIAASTAGAVAGNALFGPLGAGAGIMASGKIADAVAGTAARSYTGVALGTISRVLNKIPTDKAGNLQISKKALLNLIESLR